MKKFILAAIATSLIASPVIAAPQPQPQPQQHRGAQKTVVVKKQVNRVPAKKIVVKRNVYKPAPVQYRSNWRKGERFDARYARNYRQIDYRQYRNLKAPPRGYHYVRSGNDAVLVAIAGGVIGAVIAGAFN